MCVCEFHITSHLLCWASGEDPQAGHPISYTWTPHIALACSRDFELSPINRASYHSQDGCLVIGIVFWDLERHGMLDSKVGSVLEGISPVIHIKIASCGSMYFSYDTGEHTESLLMGLS